MICAKIVFLSTYTTRHHFDDMNMWIVLNYLLLMQCADKAVYVVLLMIEQQTDNAAAMGYVQTIDSAVLNDIQ